MGKHHETHLSRMLRRAVQEREEQIPRHLRIEARDAADELDRRAHGFVKKGKHFRAFTEAYLAAKAVLVQIEEVR